MDVTLISPLKIQFSGLNSITNSIRIQVNSHDSDPVRRGTWSACDRSDPISNGRPCSKTLNGLSG